MTNTNELTKIIIKTDDDLRNIKGKDFSDKHLCFQTIVKNIALGTLEGCVIEGGHIRCKKLSKCKIHNAQSVYADEMKLCIFHECEKVELGFDSEDYKLSASQFFRCKTIKLTEATVTDCIFNDFGFLNLSSVQMENCLVMNVVCEDDCAIFMEDGNLSDINFENITLKNDSYLIDACGDAWVENCVFMNVITERDDFELFRMEEETGKIFKKKKQYSFVDEDSCSGLDLIPLLSAANALEDEEDDDE